MTADHRNRIERKIVRCNRLAREFPDGITNKNLRRRSPALGQTPTAKAVAGGQRRLLRITLAGMSHRD